LSTLSLQNLSKVFNDTSAVQDVNLEVQSGEFFSILGPSGCGKTTLLRIIAGFESPSRGKILLDDRDLTAVPPQKRGVGMVFQNYALFPHMTVFQNVAFGLETNKRPKQEIRARVARILEAVHLSDKTHAPVPQLSGGEQQRVAVARALVVEPAVLLFDEPLSNLDAALRQSTREEIRALQRNTRTTTVYVTHDQSEAMSLSDRIAVMRSGRIEQVGTPAEMYEHAQSEFVAQFIGGANILKGVLNASDRRFKSDTLNVVLPEFLAREYAGSIRLAVKPEAVTLSLRKEGQEGEGIVETKEYLGFTTQFQVKVGSLRLRVVAVSSELTKIVYPGTGVGLEIDWARCIVLPGW
jgi:iron(III) transport system ATP-binding protein